MPIRFTCPACGAVIKGPDQAAGKKVSCPKCKAPCEVPVPKAQLLDDPAPAPPPPTPASAAASSPFDFQAPNEPAPAPPRHLPVPRPSPSLPIDQSPTVPPCPPGGGGRVAAGVCGLLIGGLGIHKFIYGATAPALIMLLVSIFSIILGVLLAFCTFGLSLILLLAPIVFGVIGFVEGIIYLTKTDEQFYQVYVIGQRGWF